MRLLYPSWNGTVTAYDRTPLYLLSNSTVAPYDQTVVSFMEWKCSVVWLNCCTVHWMMLLPSVIWVLYPLSDGSIFSCAQTAVPFIEWYCHLLWWSSVVRLMTDTVTSCDQTLLYNLSHVIKLLYAYRTILPPSVIGLICIHHPLWSNSAVAFCFTAYAPNLSQIFSISHGTVTHLLWSNRTLVKSGWWQWISLLGEKEIGSTSLEDLEEEYKILITVVYDFTRITQRWKEVVNYLVLPTTPLSLFFGFTVSFSYTPHPPPPPPDTCFQQTKERNIIPKSVQTIC